MTARIIDGKAVAAELRASLTSRLAGLPFRPRLIVILVGDDPASAVYVRNKDRAAREVGIEPETIRLPADAEEAAVLALIARLNGDDSVDGILVQLPLPKHLDAARVVCALDPAKDVDGLHPQNVAALMMGAPGLFPCTPAGCIELCDRNDIPLEGRRVAVIGRSLLVGKPLALMCLARNATVTLAHSRTRDLASVVRESEIVVAAVGVAGLVRGDWIRPGAAVIDVGMNRTSEGKLVGDVCFDEAMARAGAITPVPGGVGPMTIAMLLKNTAAACATLCGIALEVAAPRKS